MRKYLISIFLIIAVVSSVFGQLLDKPVATIDLTKPALITLSQLQIQIDLLERQYKTNLSGDDIRSILALMIDNILIDQAAEEKQISITDTEIEGQVAQYRASLGPQVTDEMFLSIIETQLGVTYYEFRERIEVELTRQKFIVQERPQVFTQIALPTDQEIERYYSRNIQSFVQPETILLEHVFFAAKSTDTTERAVVGEYAESVSEQLRSRSISFQDAVARYSQDASSKLRSGRIGYITINDPQVRQAFGDAFVDYAFSLGVGVFSPVAQSIAGYHILRVAEHLPGRLLQLNDNIPPEYNTSVADLIKRSIVSEYEAIAYQTALAQVADDLRASADIRVFEDAIESLIS